MHSTIPCTCCIIRTYSKRQGARSIKLFSFQKFATTSCSHTNQTKTTIRTTHSTQVKSKQSPLVVAQRVSVALILIFIHNPHRAMQRWFAMFGKWRLSSPVYSAFLCRTCVCFSIKKTNKKTFFGAMVFNYFQRRTRELMSWIRSMEFIQNGVEVRPSMYLVMIDLLIKVTRTKRQQWQGWNRKLQ